MGTCFDLVLSLFSVLSERYDVPDRLWALTQRVLEVLPEVREDHASVLATELLELLEAVSLGTHNQLDRHDDLSPYNSRTLRVVLQHNGSRFVPTSAAREWDLRRESFYCADCSQARRVLN